MTQELQSQQKLQEARDVEGAELKDIVKYLMEQVKGKGKHWTQPQKPQEEIVERVHHQGKEQLGHPEVMSPILRVKILEVG